MPSLANLVEMRKLNKAHFLDTLSCMGGLFSDTVKDFAQQFSSVEKQTEAIMTSCLGEMPPNCEARLTACRRLLVATPAPLPLESTARLQR